MADEPIRISIDRNRITFNEMILFEELTGFEMMELTPEIANKSRVQRAIVYIILRRTEPDITVEEAGDINIADIDFVDPTEAAPTPLKPLEHPPTTKRAKAS